MFLGGYLEVWRKARDLHELACQQWDLTMWRCKWTFLSCFPIAQLRKKRSVDVRPRHHAPRGPTNRCLAEGAKEPEGEKRTRGKSPFSTRGGRSFIWIQARRGSKKRQKILRRKRWMGTASHGPIWPSVTRGLHSFLLFLPLSITDRASMVATHRTNSTFILHTHLSTNYKKIICFTVS